MNKYDLIRRLEELHRVLGGLVIELSTEKTAEVPPQSISRLEAGLCVYCGNPVPSGMKVRRGCDEACHRRVDRRIKSGEYTDSQAIARGYWMPEGWGKAGRPTSADPAPAKKRVKRKPS